MNAHEATINTNALREAAQGKDFVVILPEDLIALADTIDEAFAALRAGRRGIVGEQLGGGHIVSVVMSSMAEAIRMVEAIVNTPGASDREIVLAIRAALQDGSGGSAWLT